MDAPNVILALSESVGLWERLRGLLPGKVAGLHIGRYVQRDENAKCKLKLWVQIRNHTGSNLHLSLAKFQFRDWSNFTADPLWEDNYESGSGKYRCDFRCSTPDPTTGNQFHDAPECDLPAGSMQDTWIGLSPDHSEETVNSVLSKKRLGWFEVRVSATVPGKSWSKCHKVAL